MRKRVLTKQVGVVLSEETYQQLIKRTDQQELPASQFIRELLEERLQSMKGEQGNE